MTQHDGMHGYGRIILLLMLPMSALAFQISPGRPLVPAATLLALTSIILAFVLLVGIPRLRSAAPLPDLLVLWAWPAVFALASVAWSPKAALTLQRTLLVFFPGALIIILCAADPRPLRTLRNLSRFLAWIALALAGLGMILILIGTIRFTNEGIIQVATMGPVEIGQRLVGTPPLLRISSLAGNPNGLASWLLFGLVALPVAWPEPDKRIKRWVFGIIIVAALLLTMSRTGIASALIALVVFQTFGRRDGLKRILAAFVLVAVVCILVVSILKGVGIDLLSSDRLSLSLSDREDAWRPLVEAWQGNMLFGQGFGIAYEALLKERGLHFGTHNGHLSLLAEIGVLGYLGVLTFWIVGVYRAWRRFIAGRLPRVPAACVLALLIAYFAQQLFEASLLRFTFANLLWIYLVAFASCSNTEDGSRSRTAQTYADI